MPALCEVLEALPHRDVRAIATRLGLRQRTQNQKAGWISAIEAAWRDPDQAARFINALSAAARAAATRLAQAGELPAALFAAAIEGLSVRRPRPGHNWSPPPWEAPQSVGEELYYCGLLAPVPPVAIEKAVRLALPTDLRSLFLTDGACAVAAPLDRTPDHPATLSFAEATAAIAGAAAAEPPASVPLETSALLHDTAQALTFLAESPQLALLHGRWLAPLSLAELNQRLLSPDPSALRSHKQAPRLRLLFFLLETAELASAGAPTPRGWQWLAQAPAERLAALWHAWRQSPPPLRQAYRQPIAVMPPPWPDLALRHLADLPPTFTARELAQVVLGREPAYTAYFTAHLLDLAAFDQAVATLLEALAADWGVLAPPADLSGARSASSAYRLTPLGQWLSTAAAGSPLAADLAAALAFNRGEAETQLQTDPDGAWQVTIGTGANPRAAADLAVFARHVAFVFDPPRHIYRLDETTVASAAAAGCGLAQAILAFNAVNIDLTPAQSAQLQAWHARGRELELLYLPLLQTARPDLLAQALSHAEVRAGIGETLAPTAAVVTLPTPALAARLRAAGFYPQHAATAKQESEDQSQQAATSASTLTHQPLDRRRPAGARQLPASSLQLLRSPAALWLAGKLYVALGEHLALPLPPPFQDLAGLLNQLPPAQQAVVQAQWQTLRSDLQTALDGHTFAPPPAPGDPARWQPMIAAAIAAGRPLTFTYFTAGRNVLTRRTVTPYWIEKQHGIPYLRADCHLAGRVRLFRLDRIQDLTIDD